MKKIFPLALGLFLTLLTFQTGCDKKSTDSPENVPSGPNLAITAPNGGETWLVGQTAEITWTSSDFTGCVTIELNSDFPSESWDVIIDNKTNNGTYSWLVTQGATQTARIRIRSLLQPEIADTSDSDFILLDSWTIMVYADGNHNLDGADDNTSYCIENIQNMELVNQLYGINVIAMLSSTRLEGGAKYYKIGYYPMELPDEISSPVLEELGEQDMSDPATLTNFLDYCAVNFPASHSVLIIDDHGEGWRGSCLDEVNGGGGLLTIPEMKNAILQSNRARTDMIVFHASGMSMVEVCSGLQGCADYLLAGQFETPMEAVLGGDFWLSWLRSNLEATPLEVSQQITQLILDASGAKGKTIQVSLIELSSMEVVNNQIEIFGQKLATENNGYWDEIRHAWNETHAITYDHPTSVDIRIFAENILLEPNLSQIASLNAAAEDVIQSIDEAVLLSLVYFNYTDPAVPRGGLNIYFPYHITQFDSLDYAALESAQSEWLSFLSSFLSHRENPIDCSDPVPITLGSPVTQFRFDDEYPQHWFQITLETGTYRFTLCDFPVGADYDLYSYRTCNDFPNNPAACTSDMEGCEDFTCQIQNTTELKILIHAYEGPMGSYTLLIQSVSDSVSVPPLSSIK